MIDFTQAPNGATHYCRLYKGVVWYRKNEFGHGWEEFNSANYWKTVKGTPIQLRPLPKKYSKISDITCESLSSHWDTNFVVEPWGNMSTFFKVNYAIATAAMVVEKPTEVGNSNWYERGEFPPVGTTCEVDYEGVWHKTYIIGNDQDGSVVFNCDIFSHKVPYDSFSNPKRFRPIQTERDKFIEKASKLFIESGYSTTNELLGTLFDHFIFNPNKE